jgi:hypothetical protein
MIAGRGDDGMLRLAAVETPRDSICSAETHGIAIERALSSPSQRGTRGGAAGGLRVEQLTESDGIAAGDADAGPSSFLALHAGGAMPTRPDRAFRSAGEVGGGLAASLTGCAESTPPDPLFARGGKVGDDVVKASISAQQLLSSPPESSPALELLCRLDTKRMPEASGIVKSRRFSDIYWVHNDSGNPALLFAIHADGRIAREYKLEIPNIDWEDIAIDNQGHLYLGDIGNNSGFLPRRAIYRIDEPDPVLTAQQPLKASAVSFYAWPRSNRFDAEGLVYDHGTAIVIAKYLDGREAEMFTVPLEPPAAPARPANPLSIGRLTGFVEPATGASLHPDQSLLAVCSYKVTRIYRRATGRPPEWKLIGVVQYDQTAIEGITWDGFDLVLVAEGGAVFRLSEKTWRGLTRTEPKKGQAQQGQRGQKRDAR